MYFVVLPEESYQKVEEFYHQQKPTPLFHYYYVLLEDLFEFLV